MKKIRFLRSSSFNMGLLFTVLLAPGVMLINYYLFIAEKEAGLKESQNAIKAQAELYSQLNRHGNIDMIEAVLTETIQSPDNNMYFALQQENGSLSLNNIPAWPAELNTWKRDFYIFDLPNEHQSGQQDQSPPERQSFQILARLVPLKNEQQLLIGRQIDEFYLDNRDFAQWLSEAFGWMMIMVLIAIALLSFLIAFYVVNRINRMTSIVNKIMNTGNLSSRLEVDSSWDDLSMLSVELNRMLSALEEMVSSVKSVSDNIAHDLRTPLTRLRGKLELAQDMSEKHRLLAEVDNILNIFNGLLRIADIETEKQKSAFRLNQLDNIVTDLISLYDALAEEKSQCLTVEIEDCAMVSDRDLLFQAFANILHNAIKFTPEGGLIKVRLQNKGKHIAFSVCDSGPGVADEHKEQLTKRFYRVESSRTSKGNGLGLALVGAVVKLHHGELSFTTHKKEQAPEQGLCCCIEFPK